MPATLAALVCDRLTLSSCPHRRAGASGHPGAVAKGQAADCLAASAVGGYEATVLSSADNLLVVASVPASAVSRSIYCSGLRSGADLIQRHWAVSAISWASRP